MIISSKTRALTRWPRKQCPIKLHIPLSLKILFRLKHDVVVVIFVFDIAMCIISIQQKLQLLGMNLPRLLILVIEPIPKFIGHLICVNEDIAGGIGIENVFLNGWEGDLLELASQAEKEKGAGRRRRRR